jgi:hypothetical protein
MLNTHLIRTKIDRLSAADGADTYWRETMLEALDEIDRLTAKLAQWAGYNPEQIKQLVAERIEQGRIIAGLSAKIEGLRQTANVHEANGDCWQRFTLAISGHPASVSPEQMATKVNQADQLEDCQHAYLRVKSTLRETLCFVIHYPYKYEEILKMITDLYEGM